jgi:hypothetical protein
MSRRVRFVAIVCIAVFAVTAVAAMPALALVDAQTPVEALFNVVYVFAPGLPLDVALPTAPAVDVRSPRPPPRSARS